jgi:hypothetical protein
LYHKAEFIFQKNQIVYVFRFRVEVISYFSYDLKK